MGDGGQQNPNFCLVTEGGSFEEKGMEIKSLFISSSKKSNILLFLKKREDERIFLTL